MSSSSFSFILFIMFLASCAGNGKKSGEGSAVPAVAAKSRQSRQTINQIKMVAPRAGDTISFNELLTLKLEYKDSLSPDSLRCFLNGEPIAYQEKPQGMEISFNVTKAGRTTLMVACYYKGEEFMTTRTVIARPDKGPKVCDYEIVKSYKHNKKSYTQGLFYHKGVLYEGTGQYGSSALQRVEIGSGKILEAVALESRYFGEGITLLDNKIYQLTWQSGQGFIYNADSFTQEGTFNYFTQGWGITTYGNKLIMSDGTNKLYLINPSGFNTEGEIEVYDRNGAVANINELEYAEGILWANVWLTNRIIGIDPQTGVVLYSLDMSKLLTENERIYLDEQDEVLNGIAYNAETGNYYVTGKHWPRLFEIKIKR